MSAPSLVVVGLNHRSAPVELLERLTIAEEDLDKALTATTNYEHILESAIVSTCNRVEVYASVTRFHGGAQDLRNFLAEFCHIAPEDFSSHLYTFHDEVAVRHLFRVCAGLDSMVVGETEIAGQVRRAWVTASEVGASKRVLGEVFQAALHAGRKARAAAVSPPDSIAQAAVDVALKRFSGTLEGRTVTVVGAGRIGVMAGQALVAAGAGKLILVNRSEDRAREVAATLPAEVVGWAGLEEALANSDLAIFATRATDVIFGAAAASRIASKRHEPILMIDIALPRDVAPDARKIPGITLLDLDDIKQQLPATPFIGSTLVEAIIDSEALRWSDRTQAADLAPTIAAIVAEAETLRLGELDRSLNALGDLTPEQREAVEKLSRRLVSKILHKPLANARELASGKDGDLHIQTLKELFGSAQPEARDER